VWAKGEKKSGPRGEGRGGKKGRTEKRRKATNEEESCDVAQLHGKYYSRARATLATRSSTPDLSSREETILPVGLENMLLNRCTYIAASGAVISTR